MKALFFSILFALVSVLCFPQIVNKSLQGSYDIIGRVDDQNILHVFDKPIVIEFLEDAVIVDAIDAPQVRKIDHIENLTYESLNNCYKIFFIDSTDPWTFLSFTDEAFMIIVFVENVIHKFAVLRTSFDKLDKESAL